MHLIILFALLSPFDFRNAAADPDVAQIFNEIVRRGVMTPQLEVAAFLIRKDDGHISCFLWPRHGSSRAAEYWGSIPAGTVAIVHTHPIDSPLPSHGDVEQAVRIQLPIYVLTTSRLHAVDPVSRESVQLRQVRSWPAGAPPCRCSEPKQTWFFQRRVATTQP